MADKKKEENLRIFYAPCPVINIGRRKLERRKIK